MSMISKLVSKSKHRSDLKQAAAKRRSDLKQAEARLAELRSRYDAGNFSGHPEEMLWDIGGAEMHVMTLRNAL